MYELGYLPPPYSHKPFSKKTLKQKAFTLAEVLITLTIIGLVAAMTIPNLLSNVQEQGFRSAFLKQYTIIKQAHSLAVKNDEPFNPDPASYNSGVNSLYYDNPKLFKSYFKIVKGPFRGDQQALDMVYGKPAYSSYIKFLNGKGASYRDSGGYFTTGGGVAFQTQDGTIMYFHMTNCHGHSVSVDVNGPKGPNQFGKDIYLLQFMAYPAYGKTPQPHLLGQLVPYGVLGTQECGGTIHRREPATDCKKNGKGLMCSREIVRNKSFKIK